MPPVLSPATHSPGLPCQAFCERHAALGRGRGRASEQQLFVVEDLLAGEPGADQLLLAIQAELAPDVPVPVPALPAFFPTK